MIIAFIFLCGHFKNKLITWPHKKRIKKFQKDDNVTAFADDVSLISVGPNDYGVFTKAKQIIAKILEWCKENGLEISALKTKAVYWTRSKKNDHIKTIKVDTTNIELSKSVKYLGVIIFKAQRYVQILWK